MKYLKSIWNLFTAPLKSRTVWISLAVLALLFELFGIMMIMTWSLIFRVLELSLRYPQLGPTLKQFTDPFKQV